MSAAARLLAEVHAARDLVREVVEGIAPSTNVGTGALWAHVRRAAGAPIDFAMDGALRANPEAARRYRHMLAGLAIAHAPMAAAASDGAVRARRVGAFALEVIPAEGASPPLLVMRNTEGGPVPRAVEAGLGPDSVRLELAEPVGGASVLALDPAVPEAALLARLLADPNSEIFLL